MSYELLESAETFIEVKKSKFISIAFPCSEYDQIKEIVAKVRKDHPHANHIVHAAVIGKDANLFSYSDDKEPKNTAGRPAFEVLKGSGITNIIICIIRYFGGTLLGTGGLVKAYQDSVRAILPILKTGKIIEKEKLSFIGQYEYYTMIKRYFKEFEINVIEEDFKEDITISVEGESANISKLKAELIRMSNDKIAFI